MNLILKPYHKNLYKFGAILVKNESPKVWLQEVQKMGFNLESVKVFPLPSQKANVLYGCLIVLTNAQNASQLDKNNYLQCINNHVFIPQNTIISPAISNQEWQEILSSNYHIFHPEIGLVELPEEVNWAELLNLKNQVTIAITSPLKDVHIPNQIQSIYFDISEEDIEKELFNASLTEEERLEKLPFDMKKLLQGNEKEFQKYLDFAEKNPELALKYAVPLDILGTSRANNNGKFSFGGNGSRFLSNFFNSVFGSNNRTNTTSSSNNRSEIFKWIFLLSISISVFLLKFNQSDPSNNITNYQSFEKNSNQNNSIILQKNNNPNKDVKAQVKTESFKPIQKQFFDSNTNIILFVFLIVTLFLILKLINNANFSLNLSRRFFAKIITLSILIGAIIYILMPMINSESNFLLILFLIPIIMLLYRIFNIQKTIFYDKKK